MAENNLKSISDLQNLKFYIPDYQRRYRWNEGEVKTLLDDINQFDDSEPNSWYCLQPLVIKKYGDGYEVIDGQQRLTTIYLILRCFSLNNDGEKISFTLKYLNEKLNNNNALNIPDKIEDNCTLNEEYIKCAYKVIKNYGEFKLKDTKPKFLNKLLNNTKFIWYEINNEKDNNPIEVFKRLNVGRIALSQSELIKALFLNRSNFKGFVSDSIYLKQLEIANEWYEIENKLQDDKFWLFISDNLKQSDNRIELLFSLLNYDSIKKNEKNELFNIYFEKFKTNPEALVNEEWTKIKYFFYTLEEWFNDYELRNFIGFLQFNDKKNFSIKKIYDISKETDKTNFKLKIKESVNKYINETLKDKNCDLETFIKSLQKGSDDEKIRTILLLHNVIESNKREEFFRYDLYKKASWDIEHIASQGGDAIPKREDDQKLWLNATKDYYREMQDDSKKISKENKTEEINEKEKSFLKSVNDFLDNKSDKEENFNNLFNDINSYYLDGTINIEDTKAINSISNLVLLDAVTNRKYKNMIFPIKRQYIIELDKAGIKNYDKEKVQYLLPCTRNAFLKYYSAISSVPNKWSSNDGENYLKALIENLKSLSETNNMGTKQ